MFKTNSTDEGGINPVGDTEEPILEDVTETLCFAGEVGVQKTDGGEKGSPVRGTKCSKA